MSPKLLVVCVWVISAFWSVFLSYWSTVSPGNKKMWIILTADSLLLWSLSVLLHAGSCILCVCVEEKQFSDYARGACSLGAVGLVSSSNWRFSCASCVEMNGGFEFTVL